MTIQDEIKKYFNSHNIYDCLEKYKSIDELHIILNIMIENQNFNNIDIILSKFPLNFETDIIKQNILLRYSVRIFPYVISKIVCMIYSDELKLKLFKEYFNSFDDNYQITCIINSLNDDNLKQQIFKDNIKYYDEEGFSNYLRRIKDDALRTKELVLYKTQFPDFRLDLVARSYSTDEKKIAIFNEFYDDTKKNQISKFIGSLKSDELKLKCLNLYVNFISPNEWWKIVTTFKTNRSIIYMLNCYANKMTSSDLKTLILQITNEQLKLELLDNVVEIMNSNDIIEIIVRIKDDELKNQVFEKYVENFSKENLYSMYVYLDETQEIYKTFIGKYIKYFDSNLLFEICSFHIKRYEYNMVEWILNNYIDIFNSINLSQLISIITQNNNIKILLKKLLDKTKNKNTIRTIYNAFALLDYEYFQKKLYKNSKIFSLEEIKICDKLLVSNSYLFQYFIFGLLDIPNLKSNFTFLNILSKYPTIAQKIVDVYNCKPQKIQLLLSLIEIVYQYDINHDSLANKLIEEFSISKDNLLTNLDVNKLNRDDLICLIFKLINTTTLASKNLIDVEINSEEDLKKYEINLLNEIDKIFLSSKNIEEAKNALLNKLFGISLSTAQEFIEMYGFSISKIENEPLIKCLKLIKKIIVEDNMHVLKEIYTTYPKLSVEEKILMEQRIKKIYNRILSDSLYKLNDKEPSGYLRYFNNSIPFYTPDNEFYLLVNSFSAYKNKEKILDYNRFWNVNKNVQNHGICCSLISNQNVVQTAPIEDVIVGFSSFSDNSIQLANSMDIYSINSDLNVSSILSIRFMLPQDFIDNTRNMHNELVLERRELRDNKKVNYENIQPSYVIIYDTFSGKQFRNSLKAAHELKIPILYLDTKKIAFNESQMLDKCKKDIMTTLDIKLFDKMLVRYENNICSFSSFDKSIIKLYFSNDKMNEFIEQLFLNIYILVQEQMLDQIFAKYFFDEAIIILQREQKKYKDSSKLFDKEPLIEKAKYYINLIDYQKNNKSYKLKG